MTKLDPDAKNMLGLIDLLIIKQRIGVFEIYLLHFKSALVPAHPPRPLLCSDISKTHNRQRPFSLYEPLVLQQWYNIRSL